MKVSFRVIEFEGCNSALGHKETFLSENLPFITLLKSQIRLLSTSIDLYQG